MVPLFIGKPPQYGQSTRKNGANLHRKPLPRKGLCFAHFEYASPVKYFAKVQPNQGVGVIDHFDFPG
jgi:hypothetical protein